MAANQKERSLASTESITVDDLSASPSFMEDLRRAQDVLEGGHLARRMREAADHGRGISQQELARRLGVSQARISTIERGNGPQGPTYELLKRIARACGVELTAHFGQPTAMSQAQEPAELQSAG
jgi:ribosome-binding protein aMBF1 (putative translation factor)